MVRRWRRGFAGELEEGRVNAYPLQVPGNYLRQLPGSVLVKICYDENVLYRSLHPDTFTANYTYGQIRCKACYGSVESTRSMIAASLPVSAG